MDMAAVDDSNKDKKRYHTQAKEWAFRLMHDPVFSKKRDS
jgi:hypothetical protein